MLPAWMNRSFVPDLSFLSIAVRELRQTDLDILGRLPALSFLDLQVEHEDLGIVEGFLVGQGSFPCLVFCVLRGFVGPVAFQQGAMPRLTSLTSRFPVREAREVACSGDIGLDLGIAKLPSLQQQQVTIDLDSEGASNEEVEELVAAVRHATTSHPNRPGLCIIGLPISDEGELHHVILSFH